MNDELWEKVRQTRDQNRNLWPWTLDIMQSPESAVIAFCEELALLAGRPLPEWREEEKL